jgi:hypothetical protein
MDPYIERPAIWPDFHDALVASIRGLLQPLVKPRYVALMQDRVYIVRDEQTRRPDVSIVRTSSHGRPGGAAAVLDVDTPAIFEVVREEVRQPLIEIIEPAAGNKVVTAIEVLSPDNKQLGPGRKSYLEKRNQYEEAGTNVIEIDLLVGGLQTVKLEPEKLESLRPWRYMVTVFRWPTPYEVYAFPLERRLPKIAVPLACDDADIPLDMQAAFTRAWEEGPYPQLLHYEDPPPSSLTEAEQRWCRQRLAESGFVSSA